jgi:hypothetical protein
MGEKDMLTKVNAPDMMSVIGTLHHGKLAVSGG